MDYFVLRLLLPTMPPLILILFDGRYYAGPGVSTFKGVFLGFWVKLYEGEHG